MNLKSILALLKKDYSLIIRNKASMMISLMVFVIFIAVYFIIPNTVAGDQTLAIYSEVDTALLNEAFTEEVLEYELVASAESLEEAVRRGDYPAGLVITEEIWRSLTSGRRTDIDLLLAPGSSQEYMDTISTALEFNLSGLSYTLQGDPLNIVAEEIVVGPDMLLEEIPIRKLMIPLFIIIILLAEMLAFGIPIIEEKENRTVTAVLAAPVTTGELLIAKGISGITMLVVQSCIFLLITGSLGTQTPTLFITVLAGAFLFVGLAFVIAGLARDMMSLIASGAFVMLTLMVPVLGIMFPGMFTSWIRVIPTYILADNLNRLINLGASWQDVAAGTGTLVAMCIGAFMAGIFILRRKLKCL